ncbi:FxDxF family PEP-CTERM protein [Azohydromonas aeria]|uniref:FxDxF family PEP-CTERM protein n=1 Tax=Azohydromonas aeria TaxID=2590212 RepID=UPI0012FB4AAB|nr:FxDxF family PEP-CTERM protein [Azohydromonas aeria]
MKMRSLVLAGLMAAGAAASHAASFSISLSPDTPLSFGRSDITETSVMDEISFTGLGEGMYKLTASLFSTDGLSFGKVSMGDKSFSSISAGNFSTAFFSGKHGGDWTLKLAGTGDGSASYTGLVSVAAVPEPETYALMLAGLGLVGVIARRRQRR